jgi:hypothetical protein
MFLKKVSLEIGEIHTIIGKHYMTFKIGVSNIFQFTKLIERYSPTLD